MKNKIRYTPEKTFTVKEDGFFGEFYRAERDQFPGKAMIAFGGSQGLFLLCQWMAEKFVDAGMNTMIIAYHGEEGLSKELKDQPADAVEKAAVWLKENGFEKIGLWGISMGGTLALLAGSKLPDLVSCVVSIAPMEMIPQAEDAKRPIDGSAFSWHGQSLPFMKYVPSDGKQWAKIYKKQSWTHKEPYARELLEEAYEANDNPDAVIPVWNINGPILLLGSYQDSMCPDEKTIPRLVQQLQEHEFSYPVETHLYAHISHLIVPVKPYSLKLFKAERKDPAGCKEDREQSWKDTLYFLHDKWN